MSAMRGDSAGAGAGVRLPLPALSEGASTPGHSLCGDQLVQEGMFQKEEAGGGSSQN